MSGPSSSLVRPAQVFSREEYVFNQARLAKLQEVLDSWKATNEHGHQEFVRMQDEMIQLVEAGERAKVVLAELREGRSSSHTATSSHHSQPSFSPTSGGASIVELPGSPPTTRESQQHWAGTSPAAGRPQDVQNITPPPRGARRPQTQISSHEQPRVPVGGPGSQPPPQWVPQQVPGQNPLYTYKPLPRRLAVQPHATVVPYYTTFSQHPPPVAMAYPQASTSSLDGALGGSDPRRTVAQHPIPVASQHDKIISAEDLQIRPHIPRQPTAAHSTELSRVITNKSEPSKAVKPPLVTAPSAAHSVPPKVVPPVPKPQPSTKTGVPLQSKTVRPPLATATPTAHPVPPKVVPSAPQPQPPTKTPVPLQSTQQAPVMPSEVSAIPSNIVYAQQPQPPVGAGNPNKHHDSRTLNFPSATANAPMTSKALVAELDTWKRTAPAKSVLDLHGGNISFYKDIAGRIQMFAGKPGQQTKIPDWLDVDYRYQIRSNEDKTSFRCQLIPQASRLALRPRIIPPQSSHVGSSSSVPPPVLPIRHIPDPSQNSSKPISGRVPAQADRKRLAKDILRSLNKGKERRFDGDNQTEPMAAGESNRQDLANKGKDRLHNDQTEATVKSNRQELAKEMTAVLSAKMAMKESLPQPTLSGDEPRAHFVPVQGQASSSFIEAGTQRLGDLTDAPATSATSGEDLSSTVQDGRPVPIATMETSNIVVSQAVDPAPLSHSALTPMLESTAMDITDSIVETTSTRDEAPMAPDPHAVPLQWVPPQVDSPQITGPPTVEQISEVPFASAEVEPIDVSSENRPSAEENLGRAPSPSPSFHQFAFNAVPSTSGLSKEPLFLPSPTGSPLRPSMAAAWDVERVEDAMLRKKPRSQVYVLVPPLPEWAKNGKARWMGGKPVAEEAGQTRKRKKLQPGEFIMGVVGRGGSRWEDYGPRPDDIRPADPMEAKALEETHSRLRERICKWRGCDVVLNSTKSLCIHLMQHIDKIENGKSSVYTCSWVQCSRKFSDLKSMERHLEQHATSPILCAYVDCDERFRRPKDLLRHNEKQHQNSKLRPAITPYKPQLPSSMGLVPRVLPAHLVEPRYVRNPQIPLERHIALGQWTLRNICGPVDVGPKRMGNASSTGYYDYDFLKRGSRVPAVLPQLDDLQSSVASLLINDGLILWGSENAEDDNWELVAKSLEAEEEEDDQERMIGSDADMTPIKVEDGDVDMEQRGSASAEVEEEEIKMLLISE